MIVLLNSRETSNVKKFHHNMSDMICPAINVLKMVNQGSPFSFDFLGTNRILSVYFLTTVFTLFVLFLSFVYIQPDLQAKYVCDPAVPELSYYEPTGAPLAIYYQNYLQIKDDSDSIIESDDFPIEHSFLPDVNDLVVTDDFDDDFGKNFVLPRVVKEKPHTDSADQEALTAVKLAVRFKKANQMEKARKLFQHAMSLSPNHPDVLLHYGEFLESDKDIINADHYYLKALILRPKNSRALSNRERVKTLVNELDLNVLKRIDLKRSALITLDKKKKDPALKRLKKEIYFQHIYHSVAIEGNTMTLAETRSIVETGYAVPGKSILEHCEIIGLESALRFVNQTLAPKNYYITTNDILEIHRRVLGHVDPVSAGTFRKSQVFVGEHTPPNPSDVEFLMEQFVETLQSSQISNMHPIHIAAYVHHRLVYIHPFTDGNGRTARLLMNLIFIKYGFPPINIRKEDRMQYYKYLQIANEGDLRPFYRFIAQATEDTLDTFLSAGSHESLEASLKALESKYAVKDMIPMHN